MFHRTFVVALALAFLALPVFASRHIVDLMVFAGLYSIAGLGVGLLLGQCGIVNLAQSVFYAIGAYASANVTVQLGWPSPAGFLIGMMVSGLTAFILGWPILRLRGYFLALATLALTLISVVLFLEWGFLTGAALGMGGIPPLSIFGFAFNEPARMYYLVWGVSLLCMHAVHNLIGSRNGYMLRAMRDAPEAAESLAIRLPVLRTKVFVLGALLGSISGSLFAHHVGFISFQSFTLEKAVLFLLIPVIGGSRSIPGIVLGAIFVTFAPEFLSKLGDLHQILFGLSLVVVVIFLPNGLVSLPSVLAGSMARKRKAPGVRS